MYQKLTAFFAKEGCWKMWIRLGAVKSPRYETGFIQSQQINHLMQKRAEKKKNIASGVYL